MKKIGIVGGVAWLSTVDYYSEIYVRSAPVTPEMSVESLDHNKAVSYLGVDDDEESWVQFDEYHRAALQRLEVSGADFAVMASNSPHHRFESIVRGVGIPVIDIFEAVAKESVRIGAKEVLILGTAVTMSSARFREVFDKHGIAAAGPGDESARVMTLELVADLQLGKSELAAERLGKISRAKAVVCLACTELPLAFPELKFAATFEQDGVVYINSTAVHINAAFDFAMAGT
jgi:aspartate racemase